MLSHTIYVCLHEYEFAMRLLEAVYLNVDNMSGSKATL